MKARLTFVAAAATLLGSAGLYPLFLKGAWLAPGAGAVLSVAAAGLLTRRLRSRALLGLAAGLVALAVYVTVLYTASEAFLWLVPTQDSLSRLFDLMAEGRQVANKYAAPVPVTPGVALLAALGMGLVAVMVDFLAVRLRHAAAAGLPLLAMYSVPAAVRQESVGWPAFLLGAVGFLWLLLADSRERVSGWGRPVLTRRWSADPPEEPVDSSMLTTTGYRVGLTAVAIAVLLPTVVPGVHDQGLFGMGGMGRSGAGARTVTTPDPLVSLKRELARQDDTVVLTYRSNDPKRPDYLRMYALDRFDGDRWTYSPVHSTSRDRVQDRTLPAPAGLHTVHPRGVTTEISVDRRVQNMTFLPMPYPPVRVAVKGDWRVHAPSLMLFSLRDAAGGRSYTVDSLHVEPTAKQLAAAPAGAPPEIMQHFLAIPGEVPESIRHLAMDKSKGASTPFEQAVKLQRWFTDSGEFTYDLSTRSPRHASDLVDFLTRSKRGYCEQYAAAMAVLARTLGIPARVAMGYTAGTQTIDGTWVVRSRDAHAWPELYFEGAGWVRFEPTPAGALGQGTANVPSYAEPVAAEPQEGTGGAVSPGAEDSTGPGAGPSRNAPPGRRPVDLGGTAGTDLPHPGGWTWPGVAAGALLALMLLSMPVIVGVVTRRRRWAGAADTATTAEAASAQVRSDGVMNQPRRPAGAADTATTAEAAWAQPHSDGVVNQPRRPAGAADAATTAEAAWAQVRSDAMDHGLPWRASESPRATARRLAVHAGLGAAATESLTRVAHAAERARYAASPASAETLRGDARAVREAFARSVPARTRWRARLAPPSALLSIRAAGGRVSRALDAMAARSLHTAQSIRTRHGRGR
ncbi:MAG TPA: DUF3488 and transglutaminase-like domain-containing protein [Actinomadura sp.]|nr:DUF3488 and transglutaminase-like domain-containing protein [Actinomadura sp.]